MFVVPENIHKTQYIVKIAKKTNVLGYFFVVFEKNSCNLAKFVLKCDQVVTEW